jgi:hypothetical protein
MIFFFFFGATHYEQHVLNGCLLFEYLSKQATLVDPTKCRFNTRVIRKWHSVLSLPLFTTSVKHAIWQACFF